MDRKEITTLDKLSIGKDAVIESVACEDVALYKHILDMGLTPRTCVTISAVAPMGDPIELSLRGYRLTLRLEDADNIEIEPIKFSCSGNCSECKTKNKHKALRGAN